MQGRWVTYIYRYREGIRCENAGFIKVQKITYRTEDEARIQIGLKLYKKRDVKCVAYLLYKDEDGYITGIPLKEMHFKSEERDIIMNKVEIPWENALNTEKCINTFDGILFVCDDGEHLAGLWNEYELVPEEVMIKDGNEYKIPTIELQRKVVEEKGVEEVGKTSVQGTQRKSIEEVQKNMIKEKSVIQAKETYKETNSVIEKLFSVSDKEVTEETTLQADKNDEKYDNNSATTFEEIENESTDVICRRIIEQYPKLPLISESQFIDGVKIVPHDIGKLSMSNWKLGINSFLSHGYYRYRYIMLGRLKRDKDEVYVIGVPGVFTNKERYLANMFGFSIFIPVKKTKVMTGNFGYWISEVE